MRPLKRMAENKPENEKRQQAGGSQSCVKVGSRGKKIEKEKQKNLQAMIAGFLF